MAVAVVLLSVRGACAWAVCGSWPEDVIVWPPTAESIDSVRAECVLVLHSLMQWQRRCAGAAAGAAAADGDAADGDASAAASAAVLIKSEPSYWCLWCPLFVSTYATNRQ